MNKIKVIISDFNFIFRKNLTVIIIFVICASLSTAFVLAFMSKFKDEFTYVKELETYKRKYNIAFLKSDVGTNEFNLEYINSLFRKNEIPHVIRMTLIEEEEYAFFVMCEFEEVLDKDILDRITELVKFDVLSLYDSVAEENALEHRVIILIILSMFLLVSFNTLNLNRYLIQKNDYRFAIYKTCGADNHFSFILIYSAPLLITAISYGIGVILYRLVVFEQFYKLDRTLLLLNWDVLLITFFVTLIYCFVLLLPSVLIILKKGATK